MKRTILSAILLILMAMIAQAQNITVRGTVLSKTDDEPLIGASVMSWDGQKKRIFIKKNDEMRLCQYGISGLFYQRVPDL